ncbi:hypothetical protein [Marinomonas sp. 2405UD68-3]|uniref:hypothetical protein n=1 Tax=Marinomonas sp. 2405UD68-3 TaxID=3391835 RepID=UPI0039C8DBB4
MLRHSIVCASILLCSNSYVNSADTSCGALICAVSPNYSQWAEQAKQSIEASATSIKDAYDTASTAAFAPKDALDGASCLDGLRGLDINAILIDPRNVFMLEFPKLIIEKITKLGCSMIVDALNKRAEELSLNIDKIGEKVSEATGGLVDIDAETNSSGGISYEYEVEALQDSELMEEISEKVNEEINEKFFGDSDPFSDSGNIDLTDPRYYKSDSSGGLSGSGTKSFLELQEGARCWLDDNCEN